MSVSEHSGVALRHVAVGEVSVFYREALPDAELRLLGTGHFALETHGEEIVRHVAAFLDRQGRS